LTPIPAPARFTIPPSHPPLSSVWSPPGLGKKTPPDAFEPNPGLLRFEVIVLRPGHPRFQHPPFLPVTDCFFPFFPCFFSLPPLLHRAKWRFSLCSGALRAQSSARVPKCSFFFTGKHRFLCFLQSANNSIRLPFLRIVFSPPFLLTSMRAVRLPPLDLSQALGKGLFSFPCSDKARMRYLLSLPRQHTLQRSRTKVSSAFLYCRHERRYLAAALRSRYVRKRVMRFLVLQELFRPVPFHLFPFAFNRPFYQLVLSITGLRHNILPISPLEMSSPFRQFCVFLSCTVHHFFGFLPNPPFFSFFSGKRRLFSAFSSHGLTCPWTVTDSLRGLPSFKAVRQSNCGSGEMVSFMICRVISALTPRFSGWRLLLHPPSLSVFFFSLPSFFPSHAVFFPPPPRSRRPLAPIFGAFSS